MFVRNILQAGDFVTIVPSGVRVTLQYNDKGMLECVYTGHVENQILHEEMLTPILKSGDIPTHVPITKGTSFVYGCLYSGDIPVVEGRLDKEVESAYVTKYLEDPSKFNFFAGSIQSYATAFNGPIPIRRWLASAGFNVLPGYMVPSNINDSNFSTILNLDKYPFRYPRIQNYIMFRNGKVSYPSTRVSQMVVKDIKKFTSYDGYILADIYGQDIGVVNTSYADVVNLNIHVGSILLVDEDNKIIDCFNDASMKGKYHHRQISCKYCGKMIQVPQKGRFRCTESHCASVMFDRVTSMLSVLGVELLAFEKYKEVAKDLGNTVSLPDILDFDMYQDTQITASVPKVLQAAVPRTILTRDVFYDSFANRCNNSIDTIKYYAMNPDMILTDLKLDKAVFGRLVNWLHDVQNANDVIGLLTHPNIKLQSTNKKFEGAPIFRDKTIFITGKFNHGDSEEISAIFSSYGAGTSTKFYSAVDCVVVGDTHEDISGVDIKKARQMNIPVFEESEFFGKYEIDVDLRQNLG